MDIIQNCQQYFAVELPSNLWAKRVDRFEKKFAESSNSFVTSQFVFVRLHCSVS